MTESNTQRPGIDAVEDTLDWESTVLSRVARHVKALPDSPPEAEDFGWEEGVLENLRKRLAANE